MWSPQIVFIYRKRYFGKGAEMLLWQGTMYRNDRVFIPDLQLATKGDRQVWAVTTRRNVDRSINNLLISIPVGGC